MTDQNDINNEAQDLVERFESQYAGYIEFEQHGYALAFAQWLIEEGHAQGDED